MHKNEEIGQTDTIGRIDGIDNNTKNDRNRQRIDKINDTSTKLKNMEIILTKPTIDVKHDKIDKN